MVAVKVPMETAPSIAAARSGSTKGGSPRLMDSMRSMLTLTPVTCTPRVASTVAVGRPM